MASGTGYYVLDAFGGLHAGGTAPAPTSPPPYFGFDAARDISLVPESAHGRRSGYGLHGGHRSESLPYATPVHRRVIGSARHQIADQSLHGNTFVSQRHSDRPGHGIYVLGLAPAPAAKPAAALPGSRSLRGQRRLELVS